MSSPLSAIQTEIRSVPTGLSSQLPETEVSHWPVRVLLATAPDPAAPLVRQVAIILELVQASLEVHERASRKGESAKQLILAGDLLYTDALSRIPRLEDASLEALLHEAISKACMGKLLRKLPPATGLRGWLLRLKGLPDAYDPGALIRAACEVAGRLSAHRRPSDFSELGRRFALSLRGDAAPRARFLSFARSRSLDEQAKALVLLLPNPA